MSSYEITYVAIPIVRNPGSGIISPPVQKLSVDDVKKWQKRGKGVCEGCYKHLRSSHNDGSSCAGCLPADVVTLRKCARCKALFYCTKACQKEHWKDHKQYCSSSRAEADKKEKETYAARCDSLTAFCKNGEIADQLGPILADIADAAMKEQSPERHVLLVHVDWAPNTDKTVPLSPLTPQFRHIIRTVGLVPISRIQQILDAKAAESAKDRMFFVGPDWNRITMKELAPRAGGWIPTLVIDDGLDFPNDNLALHVRYRSEPKVFRAGSTLWNIRQLVYGGESVDPWQDCMVDPDMIMSMPQDAKVGGVNVRY
ncbi:hypothetical protein BV25DRAFT_1826715 [Artomyces pyxidatus]|uniref:Uncharacterized protein n=1 Tax=Artomyces pyxidatus TaxID=48021 RepID=A0ACB8SXW6_9AGAM|nr:hypothetical protein BV25DRAFT_1826715 [Artomyces pyxidatus]